MLEIIRGVVNDDDEIKTVGFHCVVCCSCSCLGFVVLRVVLVVVCWVAERGDNFFSLYITAPFILAVVQHNSPSRLGHDEWVMARGSTRLARATS